MKNRFTLCLRMRKSAMKKYILMVSIVLAGISSDGNALTYREAAENAWSIADKWFPNREKSNALALCGYYDVTLKSAVRASGLRCIAQDEVSPSRIDRLDKILTTFDLLLSENVVQGSAPLSERELAQAVGQELIWISSGVKACITDESIDNQSKACMNLYMLALLVGFIDKVVERSTLFRTCFVEYCQALEGADAIKGSWTPLNPYKEAFKLIRRGASDRIKNDTLKSYGSVAARVQRIMIGVDSPFVPRILCPTKLFVCKFLRTIPKSPFPRVAA
jgi:hypothetical protein